jgi:acetyl esterase/lipase
MSYATGLAEFIERSNRVLPPDFWRAPVGVQRKLYEGLVEEFHFDRPPGVSVQDDHVDADRRRIGLRVYRPAARRGRGALLYMHGGGFVLGSLETHDTLVAELADKTGLVVIAVDFRPAPEHPFPAPLEDCYDALVGVVAQAERFGIDPAHLGVAGDSSGANLAVALCLAARDRGGPPIRAQALISPVLNFARWRGGGKDAPLLSGDEMIFFTRCYTGNPEHLEDPYVSPLLTAQFHGLPPAYIMAAEQDSLCADAVAYASELHKHRIPAQLSVEPGLVHACVRARGLSPEVADAWARFCTAAEQLLAESPAPHASLATTGI